MEFGSARSNLLPISPIAPGHAGETRPQPCADIPPLAPDIFPGWAWDNKLHSTKTLTTCNARTPDATDSHTDSHIHRLSAARCVDGIGGNTQLLRSSPEPPAAFQQLIFAQTFCETPRPRKDQKARLSLETTFTEKQRRPLGPGPCPPLVGAIFVQERSTKPCGWARTTIAPQRRSAKQKKPRGCAGGCCGAELGRGFRGVAVLQQNYSTLILALVVGSGSAGSIADKRRRMSVKFNRRLVGHANAAR